MFRERNLILASLFVLAVSGWVFLTWQSTVADNPMMGVTMGMDAALFLLTWVVMMVAMMFPTAAPMIVTFARVHAGRQQRGQAFVPTWVFVSSYLLVWTLFGVIAYVLATKARAVAESSTWLMGNSMRLAGGILVLAGLYQLSPLKGSCLSKCRTPLDFILNSWRDGYAGSFRMGLEHGAYCVGCCWLLFVILFPLGVMNVAAMAMITLLIFAEKSLPAGPRISRIAGIMLIVYGTVAVFIPTVLPLANQFQPK